LGRGGDEVRSFLGFVVVVVVVVAVVVFLFAGIKSRRWT